MKKKKNEFHAYWQCPFCGYANMDVADDFLINIRDYICKKCNKKVSLKKNQEHVHFIKNNVQILCVPYITSN